MTKEPAASRPGKPAFGIACPWGNFVPPQLARVGRSALARGTRRGRHRLLSLARGDRRRLARDSGRHAGRGQELIQRWLAAVESSSPIVVPEPSKARCDASARRPDAGLRAKGRRARVAASPGLGTDGAQSSGNGSDFALRLGQRTRRAQRSYSRIASVGRRPAGRRDWELAATSPPARVAAARGAPRPRSPGQDGTRRVELAIGALGREGALAPGRR